jgi:hypothetical protein
MSEPKVSDEMREAVAVVISSTTILDFNDTASVAAHHAKIDRLLTAIGRLEQDSRRLDWLNGREAWFVQPYRAYKQPYANVREAIDAAITKDSALAAASTTGEGSND